MSKRRNVIRIQINDHAYFTVGLLPSCSGQAFL